jgi:hypothetical protein
VRWGSSINSGAGGLQDDIIKVSIVDQPEIASG